jgi:predicted GIY-YIG superfamily endonuclease
VPFALIHRYLRTGLYRRAPSIPQGERQLEPALIEACVKPFFVYMFRCADGSYYVGHTDELDRRVAQHQAGEIDGYTHSRRPVTLVWSQETTSREEALAAEQQIKRWARAKKEALIRGDWKAIQRHAWGTRNPVPAHLQPESPAVRSSMAQDRAALKDLREREDSQTVRPDPSIPQDRVVSKGERSRPSVIRPSIPQGEREQHCPDHPEVSKDQGERSPSQTTCPSIPQGEREQHCPDHPEVSKDQGERSDSQTTRPSLPQDERRLSEDDQAMIDRVLGEPGPA